MSNKRRIKVPTPTPQQVAADRFKRLMAFDRAYFERHKDTEVFQRPYVPGETWSVPMPAGTTVIVRSLGPGRRVREFGDGWSVIDIDPGAEGSAAA